MFHHFQFDTFSLCLAAASVITTAVALAVFLIKTIPVVRGRVSSDRRAPDAVASPTCIGASVIVYCADQHSDLQRLLPQLLAQRYDGEWEIIIVNEGDSSEVRRTVEEFQTPGRNIYLTHTPDGARNLSRKKLALTLGIKASRYPVAVLTMAATEIHSSDWLTLMTSHFSAHSPTEMVIGYATAPRGERLRDCSRAAAFDTVADSVIWLAPALSGRPWRGTEYNIAYRRDLFFRTKGFSGQLTLRDGDDDIFVSHVAAEASTAVELATDATVTVPGFCSKPSMRRRLARRRFTESFIKRRPRVLAQIGWWAYSAAPLLAVGALAASPRLFTSQVACALALLMWYPAGLAWMRAARILGPRRLRLTLPFLAASRPWRTILRTALARRLRAKRYTWE